MMGLRLSLVILGDFLEKLFIFKVKFGFLCEGRQVVLFMKLVFKSISRLGFSKKTRMMVLRVAQGSPLIGFIKKHKSRSRIE